MEQIVNKIFIVHYKPLENRKKYLDKYLIDNNIKNYEYRTLFQRETLTEETREKYFKLNDLNNAQICITIEHIEIYKKIIELGIDGWYLIIEDDAHFCHDFIKKINDYLKIVPEDAEYLDIGDYNHSWIDIKEKWNKFPFTRTNLGYLIKKSTCEKIIKTIIPFTKAIDHELNKQFVLHNLNVYHVDNPLILNGNYGSSYTKRGK